MNQKEKKIILQQWREFTESLREYVQKKKTQVRPELSLEIKFCLICTIFERYQSMDHCVNELLIKIII